MTLRGKKSWRESLRESLVCECVSPILFFSRVGAVELCKSRLAKFHCSVIPTFGFSREFSDCCFYFYKFEWPTICDKNF